MNTTEFARHGRHSLRVRRAVLRAFMDRLAEHRPVELVRDPRTPKPFAAWRNQVTGGLDSLAVFEYNSSPFVVRFSINCMPSWRPSAAMAKRLGVPRVAEPVRGKEFELSVLDSEAATFAGWMAAFVLARETGDVAGLVDAPPPLNRSDVLRSVYEWTPAADRIYFAARAAEKAAEKARLAAAVERRRRREAGTAADAETGGERVPHRPSGTESRWTGRDDGGKGNHYLAAPDGSTGRLDAQAGVAGVDGIPDSPASRPDVQSFKQMFENFC